MATDNQTPTNPPSARKEERTFERWCVCEPEGLPEALGDSELDAWCSFRRQMFPDHADTREELEELGYTAKQCTITVRD